MRVKWVYKSKENHGKRLLLKESSLLSALKLPLQKHMVIAFTGGGGKTSAMYSLADELAAKGKHVLITTSTHIFYPKDRTVVVAGQAETVHRYVEEYKERSSPDNGWVLVTGQTAPEEKLKGMPLREMEKLADLADILLVEADGAKRLPFKIPKEGEPVLLDNTHVVIGCAGMDCIGRSWVEKCFRWELAENAFHWQIENSLITPDQVARVLISTKGTRKNAEGLEYRMLLNKADDEIRMSQAADVITFLGKEWEDRCVVTSFRI